MDVVLILAGLGAAWWWLSSAAASASAGDSGGVDLSWLGAFGGNGSAGGAAGGFALGGVMVGGKMSADVAGLIDKYAALYGVDPALARAQAQAESGGLQFRPDGSVVTSSAGALGVFQLMPKTAAGLGVDPRDTEQNIQGGIKYLASLLQEFGGDKRLALAAYNAGPGNVRKYGGVPPFPETQAYVNKILGTVKG